MRAAASLRLQLVVTVCAALASGEGKAPSAMVVSPMHGAFFGAGSKSDLQTVQEEYPQVCTRMNLCDEVTRRVFYASSSGNGDGVELFLYWRTWDPCRVFSMEEEEDCDESAWKSGWVLGLSLDYFDVIAYTENTEFMPCMGLSMPTAWQFRKSTTQNIDGFSSWLAQFKSWNTDPSHRPTLQHGTSAWQRNTLQLRCAVDTAPAGKAIPPPSKMKPTGDFVVDFFQKAARALHLVEDPTSNEFYKPISENEPTADEISIGVDLEVKETDASDVAVFKMYLQRLVENEGRPAAEKAVKAKRKQLNKKHAKDAGPQHVSSEDQILLSDPDGDDGAPIQEVSNQISSFFRDHNQQEPTEGDDLEGEAEELVVPSYIGSLTSQERTPRSAEDEPEPEPEAEPEPVDKSKPEVPVSEQLTAAESEKAKTNLMDMLFGVSRDPRDTAGQNGQPDSDVLETPEEVESYLASKMEAEEAERKSRADRMARLLQGIDALIQKRLLEPPEDHPMSDPVVVQ